jgi:hypothetical protein
MGKGRRAYRIFVGDFSEGGRPLGRPSSRWKNNIKMVLQEIGWWAWTGLLWLRIGTSDVLL